MRIALGQINPTVGDFPGNLALAARALKQAEGRGADLLVLPELALSGYPPKDLLERRGFLTNAECSLDVLRELTGDVGVVVGFPEVLPISGNVRPLANSAALLHQKKILSVHRKSLLPTYDVFDERRYFEPAEHVEPTLFRGKWLGISICEDVWNDSKFWPRRIYSEDPIEQLVRAGADILINISASPYTIKKRDLRKRMLENTAKRWRKPLVFVNQVGGQDDLIFDGASLVLDAEGGVIAQAAEHSEDLVIADLDTGDGDSKFWPSEVRSVLNALTLGTKDYARRCGFSKALIGLSGGIDSAVVACIAARALGPTNVLGVAMPSRFSSEHSRKDAADLARALGIQFRETSIEPMYQAYLDGLAPAFEGYQPDVTEENLQARIRGGVLMALSNKTGALLLSTGNKSEVATGYFTIYGDSNGGLAVISDVPKTLVYKIAQEINSSDEVIPRSTLTKPPSAELRLNQTDQDSLPPYDVLDAILDAYVEQNVGRDGLVAMGFDPKVVEDVLRLVRRSEHKRRQLPPGLKITSKAFGTGRRYPIAQAFPE